MSKRFPEYNGLKLPEINDSVLEQWGNENVFARTMSEREGCPSFVFFEGPPSANGKPGIHHVLARTIKDIFCRYKTMQGFQVKRKAGWDTHGLPVELGVEKNLGITKEDIGKKISVDEYNAACRREVMKYTGEWEDLTRRMGYWVDMPNAYITYDNRYIETVWWLLGQLYEKGYLYKGYTIQPYSPAAGTGLSSHELNQPGCYRDVKDTTCVAQFRVLDNDNPSLAPYRELLFKWGTPYFLAWTTTPWTLPSNTALAVGPEITYNIVRTYNPYSGKPITVVAADALMGSLFNPKAKDLPLDSYSKGDKLIPYEVAAQVKGLDLVGHLVGSEFLVFLSDQIVASLIDQQIALEGRFLVEEGHAGFETAVGSFDVAIAVVDADDDRRIVIQNVHKIPFCCITAKGGPQTAQPKTFLLVTISVTDM